MSQSPPRLALVQPIAADAAPPLSEQCDDDLMLLARGGQARAFDELVRRHQRHVVRIAARYLGDPASAADAAQATVVELYRALPRYHPQGRFPSYLYRVLINQCHRAKRARRSQGRAFDTLSTEPSQAVNIPDHAILARERAREVEHALAELSPKLRDVLVLRFTGEVSYDEIAAILQLPLGTVKRRIFDGIEKLRLIMEGDRKRRGA
jgi:RNA polymerase sigma-70 factor (ECF subfamily)